MADLSEVEQALVALVAGAAYPLGTGAPSIGSCPILVYAGWPNPQQLDTDLHAGTVHISVFSRPGDRTTHIARDGTGWRELTNDGTIGTAARDIRWQLRQFQITVWAGLHDLRDLVAGPIDVALGATSRLALPNDSLGTLRYVNSVQNDSQQKTGIYRRDVFYSVEYPTTQVVSAFVIKEVDVAVTALFANGDPINTQ